MECCTSRFSPEKVQTPDRLRHAAHVRVRVQVMSRGAGEMVRLGRKAGKRVYGEPIAAGLGTDGTQLFCRCWRHAAAHVMGPPLRPDPTVKHYLMDMLATGRP